MDNVRLVKRIKYRNLLLPAFIAFSINSASGQGNLLVNPKRLVFNESVGTQEINLANIGKDTARYIISTVEMRMKPDGGFERITAPDSGQLFASSYVRFFPRIVTLAPNEAQTVRVQIAKNKQLQEGEYRSHIYFRADPFAETSGGVVDSNQISVSLKPVFGLTIPVIITIGKQSTSVDIPEAFVKKEANNEHILSMNFERYGNMSAYGDVTVDHISAKGEVARVAEAKGLAIYTPNSMRNFALKLNQEGAQDYNSGKLHIKYTAKNSANKKIWAEKILQLPTSVPQPMTTTANQK